VYLEKTKMVAPLPDDKCTGPKPPDIQACEAPVPCAAEDGDYESSDEDTPIVVAAVKTTSADRLKTPEYR